MTPSTVKPATIAVVDLSTTAFADWCAIHN
jgi:hypothetical protein